MFHLDCSRSMRGPAWAAIACVLGIALAASPAILSSLGRGDPTADGEDEPLFAAATSTSAGRSAPILHAPLWVAGDAWHVSFDGYEECFAVVAVADESGYRHGWTCAEDGEAEYIATQASAFALLYAGKLTPDLGGRYGDSTFSWFDWPLSDGKSWEADLYGSTVDVTASWDPKTGRYVMRGVIDDEPWATWDYAPEFKWFGQFRYASGWTFAVLDRVTQWQEQVTLADTALRYSNSGNQIVARYMTPGTFDAEDADEALYVWVQRGGFHAERVQLRAPDGSTVYDSQSSNVVGGGRPYEGSLLSGSPGTWTIVRAGASTGYSSLTVWGVSFTRERVA